MNLEDLNSEIKLCKKCSLYKTRTNVVPGSGPSNAKIVLIGEAPGQFEDIKGEPFVGRAGALLTEILNSVGIKRNEIFITNIVKCRPPGNRDPLLEEIKVCSPYLDKQLEIIKPKLIISLGRFSMYYLMEKFNLPKESITKAHGKLFTINTLFGPLKFIPTYHPAAALYNPNLKSFIFEDFKKIPQAL